MLSQLAEAKQRILRLEKENRELRRDLQRARDEKARLTEAVLAAVRGKENDG